MHRTWQCQFVKISKAFHWKQENLHYLLNMAHGWQSTHINWVAKCSTATSSAYWLLFYLYLEHTTLVRNVYICNDVWYAYSFYTKISQYLHPFLSTIYNYSEFLMQVGSKLACLWHRRLQLTSTGLADWHHSPTGRIWNENIWKKRKRFVPRYSLFVSRPAFAAITANFWRSGVCCNGCWSCCFKSWMSGDISDMGVPNTSSHASCISWSNISDEIWSSVNISTLK